MTELTCFPTLSISFKEFDKNEAQATKQQIKTYQEKVRLVLYAVITTRPDIARVSSTLSKFLTNSSDKHMKAINQTILYLYTTQFLAVKYTANSNNALFIASNILFGDDLKTQHLSQEYIITLFGGPVI